MEKFNSLKKSNDKENKINIENPSILNKQIRKNFYSKELNNNNKNEEEKGKAKEIQLSKYINIFYDLYLIYISFRY